MSGVGSRVAATPLGPRPSLLRGVAILGAAGLTLSYLSVLAHVVDVAGGGLGLAGFALLAVGSLAAGAVAAHLLRPRWALALGGLLLALGLLVYLRSVPGIPFDLVTQAGDTAALLSGMSVLRVTNAGVWALALTPAPVLVSWYFVVREEYAAGVLVGGVALGVFVLSGDLGTVSALVGVLAGAAAVGFGRLDREGADPSVGNTVAAILVGMLVLTTSASLVPGGQARPLGGGDDPTTVETSLTGEDASVEVRGSISLSPAVRFTVEAPSPEYWRVAAYDRYTGQGWVRTGDSRPYSPNLPTPPGVSTVRLPQAFRAESTTGVLPAAWRPVEFASGDVDARVTELGGFQPSGTLSAGDTYRVRSVVPRPSPARLRGADDDYPARIEARYLSLPQSTPDRLGRFTANLTADAEGPFETTVTVERWLEANKAYSLDVDRPSGDVATAFVFEMNAGYCVYYATAMVAMLRTQGIPARFATGYLPGQDVGDDTWVVRGYDSHAWVEVYFSDVGWVRFDPTPAAPRQDRELDRLGAARTGGEANVDTNQSSGVPVRTDGDPTIPEYPTFGFLDPNESLGPVDNGSDLAGPGADEGAAGGGDEPGGPSPEAILYGLILVLGGATAAVQLELPQRLYRRVWLRRLPAGPPARRIEAAVDRAEYLLGRQYRPRRPHETRRSYVETLRQSGASERAARLFDLGERARFAGEASERDADVAASLLADVRTELERSG